MKAMVPCLVVVSALWACGRANSDVTEGAQAQSESNSAPRPVDAPVLAPGVYTKVGDARHRVELFGSDEENVILEVDPDTRSESVFATGKYEGSHGVFQGLVELCGTYHVTATARDELTVAFDDALGTERGPERDVCFEAVGTYRTACFGTPSCD